jgi:hypothetical protein
MTLPSPSRRQSGVWSVPQLAHDGGAAGAGVGAAIGVGWATSWLAGALSWWLGDGGAVGWAGEGEGDGGGGFSAAGAGTGGEGSGGLANGMRPMGESASTARVSATTGIFCFGGLGWNN